MRRVSPCNENADCKVTNGKSARVNADGSVTPTALKIVTEPICPPNQAKYLARAADVSSPSWTLQPVGAMRPDLLHCRHLSHAIQALPSTSVTMSGGGMLPGEVVTNDVVANKQSSENLCSAVVAADGTWSCTRLIGFPVNTSYSIVSTGSLSHNKDKGSLCSNLIASVMPPRVFMAARQEFCASPPRSGQFWAPRQPFSPSRGTDTTLLTYRR